MTSPTSKKRRLRFTSVRPPATQLCGRHGPKAVWAGGGHGPLCGSDMKEKTIISDWCDFFGGQGRLLSAMESNFGIQPSSFAFCDESHQSDSAELRSCCSASCSASGGPRSTLTFGMSLADARGLWHPGTCVGCVGCFYNKDQ